MSIVGMYSTPTSWSPTPRTTKAWPRIARTPEAWSPAIHLGIAWEPAAQQVDCRHVHYGTYSYSIAT